MSSQRRIDASKRNGARSPGPKTPAGKRRSSINAMRHGLLAKCVVLEGESEEHFLLLVAQHHDKFAPRDDIEFGLIEDLVACYWRLRRAMSIDRRVFDEAMDKSAASDGIHRLGKAWEQIGDSPKLLHLHRYQSKLNRMHHRALSNLLMLRGRFPDDAKLPNEPIPISGHSAAGLPPAPPTPSTRLPSPKSTVAPDRNHASVLSRRPKTYTHVHCLAIRARPSSSATYTPSRSRPESTVTFPCNGTPPSSTIRSPAYGFHCTPGRGYI
jgi:hypothetical protein